MTTLASKICIVGDFGVGKTSTVERFVNSQFSDKYLTTVGVKVDTKQLALDGYDHKLIIWDIAGTGKFGELEFSYLKGAAGYLLVADGTRPNTVKSGQGLNKQIVERYGELPHVVLVNKSDLKIEWEVNKDELDLLRRDHGEVFVTSAKTGDAVERAFSVLSSQIVGKNLDT